MCTVGCQHASASTHACLIPVPVTEGKSHPTTQLHLSVTTLYTASQHILSRLRASTYAHADLVWVDPETKAVTQWCNHLTAAPAPICWRPCRPRPVRSHRQVLCSNDAPTALRHRACTQLPSPMYRAPPLCTAMLHQVYVAPAPTCRRPCQPRPGPLSPGKSHLRACGMRRSSHGLRVDNTKSTSSQTWLQEVMTGCLDLDNVSCCQP